MNLTEQELKEIIGNAIEEVYGYRRRFRDEEFDTKPPAQVVKPKADPSADLKAYLNANFNPIGATDYYSDLWKNKTIINIGNAFNEKAGEILSPEDPNYSTMMDAIKVKAKNMLKAGWQKWEQEGKEIYAKDTAIGHEKYIASLKDVMARELSDPRYSDSSQWQKKELPLAGPEDSPEFEDTVAPKINVPGGLAENKISLKEELTKEEVKKIIKSEIARELRQELKGMVEEELKKVLKDRKIKNEIGDISKDILKKLYKDLSIYHTYVIDRVKM